MGRKFLENLVKQVLPQDYASKIRLEIIDARAIDAPFSLDVIEIIPER